MTFLRCKAWLAGSMLALLATGAQAAAGDSVDAVDKEFRTAHKERALGVDKCLDWIERLYALSETHAGTEEGFDALGLVMQIADVRPTAEIREAAAKAPGLVVAGYADHPKLIGPFLMRGADEALVKEVLARTKSPAVKATCLYVEAVAIADMGYAAKIPTDLAEHALGLLRTIRDEYGEVEAHDGSKFKDVIAGDLFQLENLRIGMVAPDIEGADLDGVPFKLSDYRGKVVVLDFWGNW